MGDFSKEWAEAEAAAAAQEQGLPAPQTEPEPEAAETAEPAEPAKAETPATDDKQETDSDPEKENEGKVLPSERAGFRAEKRKWKERQAKERETFEQERAQFKAQVEPLMEARKLYEAGDPEAAIRKAFGVEFKDFTQDVVKRAHGKDPRVERILREREEEKRQQAEQAQRAQLESQKRQQAQRQQAYVVKNIVQPLKASEGDEQAQAIAETPALVDAIFQAQREAYDEDTDSTISLEEAREIALKKFRPAFEQLARIYGDRSASLNETSQGVPDRPGKAAAKTGQRARHVPQSRATSAARNAPPPTDDAAWFEYATRTMREAAAEEAAANKQR